MRPPLAGLKRSQSRSWRHYSERVEFLFHWVHFDLCCMGKLHYEDLSASISAYKGMYCSTKKRKTVSYLGLSQSRVRNLTPPPQVREHCPNSLHEPQFPSCFIMSGVSQMQWPLKQCCDRQKTQDRFSICLILASSRFDLCIMHQLVSESWMPAALVINSSLRIMSSNWNSSYSNKLHLKGSICHLRLFFSHQCEFKFFKVGFK